MRIIYILTIIFTSYVNGQTRPVSICVSPRVFRTGTLYSMAVSTNGLQNYLTMTLKIVGAGGTVTKTVNANPNATTYVMMATKALPAGIYNLSVSAYEPNKFRTYAETIVLKSSNKLFSFYIQTDKVLYKTNDPLKFRVFAIDSSTNAYSLPKNASVIIRDADNLIVEQYINVVFVIGKFESIFQISDKPNLGLWNITVSAEGQTYTKTIEVEEFIPNLFSVNVVIPPFIPLSDGSFPLSIRSETSFGKQVLADANVVIYRYKWDQTLFNYVPVPVFQRNMILDANSKMFTVNMADDLQVSYLDYDENFDVELYFKDKNTGKVIARTGSFIISKYKYKLQYNGSKTFTPNQTFPFQFYVINVDGTPAPVNSTVSLDMDLGTFCTFNVTTSQWICFNNFQRGQQNFTVNNLGMISGAIAVGQFDYLTLTATYGNAKILTTKILKNVTAPSTPPASLIGITVLTPQPKIGVSLDIKINTSTAIPYVFYHTFAKEILIFSEKLLLVNNSVTLKLMPNITYSPSMDIVVFYFNSLGNIVSKRATVNFDEQLPNYLTLELGASNVKPLANSTLKISSSLGSVVSLFALDLNLVAMRDGLEFTSKDIISDIASSYYTPEENIGWNLAPIDEQDLEKSNMAVIKMYIDYSTTLTTTKAPITTVSPTTTTTSTTVAPTTIKTTVIPPLVGTGCSSIQNVNRKRNLFETALWQSVTIATALVNGTVVDKVKGVQSLSFFAPSSTTGYMISGFSMSDTYGVAFPTVKPILTVYQPFFVQMDLPHSVHPFETVIQDFTIFSFMSQSQTVTTSLKLNNLTFSIIDAVADGWKVTADNISQSVVSVPNVPLTLRMRIQPKVIGSINIKVTALGSLAVNSADKYLNVIPEGILRTVTNSTFIVKPLATTTIAAEVSCTVPPTAINNTISVTANVFSDILGDSYNNLQNFILMPYGSGEQNMIRLVPNIIIMKYLEIKSQLTTTMKTIISANTDIGYQNELKYQRPDGSFSDNGINDEAGSTFLTAYVVKYLIIAQSYITVDPRIITNGLSFLISKQNTNGSFREDGLINHQEMQGGIVKGVALSSYISIILSENSVAYPQYKTANNKTLAFIATYLNTSDVYALAISSYALYLGRHVSFNTVYAKFLNKSTETTDMMYWKDPTIQVANTWLYSNALHTTEIEIASYGAMLFRYLDTARTAKITKYLVYQKDLFGSHGSSQDTVMALKALADVSLNFTVITQSLSIKLTPNVGVVSTVNLNATSLLAVTTINQNILARKISVGVATTFTGRAIASITCKFYEMSDEPSPSFIITHSFTRACKGFLRSSICLNFVTNTFSSVSNMVTMRMNLPSGFIYDPDTLVEPTIKKLERLNEETTVNVYMAGLTSTPTCFTIDALQAFPVVDLKDLTIEVFDVYDLTKYGQKSIKIPAGLPDC